MKYTLMHKHIPVVDVEFDGNGDIRKVLKTHDVRHAPLGVHAAKQGIGRTELNAWWSARAVPKSREGLEKALATLGLASATALAQRCLGLSLADQYWVRPAASDMRWDDVNFFANGFAEEIGNALFGQTAREARGANLASPDSTSDGVLVKRWVMRDGAYFLMKGGSGVFRQQPFNEVIASRIMGMLNVPHAEYTLEFHDDSPYCLCEDFVTAETELVTAWDICKTEKKPNNISTHTHLLNRCDALGISGCGQALDRMLTLDYIIANEDRHFRNFGFLRNAETLAWLGPAPIYDSGTSLWYNTMHVGSSVNCKPFRETHQEQIKLVRDLAWFNARLLDGVADSIMETLSQSNEVDSTRAAKIASTVSSRIEMIARLESP
jgi:hypothetical protein